MVERGAWFFSLDGATFWVDVGGKHGPQAAEHGEYHESMGMPIWLCWDMVQLITAGWLASLAELRNSVAEYGWLACLFG